MSATAVADDTGAPLDGAHRYRLHLPARMPTNASWSLSIYRQERGGRSFFEDNVLHRWSIGDRTAGLRRNTDGSLDILIQHDPPPEWTANWLPMPRVAPRLVLRSCQPARDLLDGSCRYPAVEGVDR